MFSSKDKGAVGPFLLMGFALVALLLAAVSCGGASGEQGSAGSFGQDAPEEPQAEADLEHPSIGEDDAPVVLIEYSDFQ